MHNTTNLGYISLVVLLVCLSLFGLATSGSAFYQEVHAVPLNRPDELFFDDFLDICMRKTIGRHLRSNGWVKDSVSDDDLESYILLAEQFCSTVDNVKPELTIAQIAIESRFDPRDEYEGALGLMQMIPRWHRDRLESYLGRTPTNEDWSVPANSIFCGVSYMSEIIEKTKDLESIPESDKTAFALMRYNQGVNSASNTYLNRNTISSYAKRIIKLSNEIGDIYAKGDVYRA